MPRGILKNARIDASYKTESPNELDHEKAVFDRQQVIENTKINAKLTHDFSSSSSLDNINEIKQLQLKHDRGEKLSEEEQLRWDERNLLINEMEKSATMKIDEPKTPYEGGFDPNNDYYRTDNENENDEENKDKEDEEDDNDEFALGEGVDDTDDVKKGDIEVVTGTQPEVSPPEVSHELTAEEKHRLFEEKRKQHYHLKAAPLHHHDDNELEDED